MGELVADPGALAVFVFFFILISLLLLVFIPHPVTVCVPPRPRGIARRQQWWERAGHFIKKRSVFVTIYSVEMAVEEGRESEEAQRVLRQGEGEGVVRARAY
jgi:hypothetical protein